MPQRTRLDGIVIRHQPLGEADVILTMVSAEEGRVDVLARGGRKPGKRFAGGIALFSELAAVLEHGRGHLPTLAESSRRAAYLQETPGYGQLALASYVAELAACASQPGHADGALFAWLGRALHICENAEEDRLRTPRLAVELAFLHVVGVCPDMQTCSQCGREIADGATWRDADAGLACTRCLAPQAETLPAAWLRAFRSWTQRPLQPPLAVLPPSPAWRIAESRVAALIRHVAPQPPRSAQALRDLTRLEA